jgi:tRNA(Ile)-lysidine synthase
MAVSSDLLRRPLLGLRRAQTEAACAALGLTPWQDPMNDDPTYARVRLRGQVLPLLEQAIGPGVAEALSRTAEQLAADNEALDSWAAQALTAATDELGGLSVDSLGTLPQAVRTRVLRSAALRAGVPGGSLTAVHVLELDRLVTDWHGQGRVALPGPYGAIRDCDRLLLVNP